MIKKKTESRRGSYLETGRRSMGREGMSRERGGATM